MISIRLQDSSGRSEPTNIDEQAVAPNRSQPPTQKSTSSDRGSEEKNVVPKKMKVLLSIILTLSAVCSNAESAKQEGPPAFIREIVAIKIPKIEAKDTTPSELIDFIALRIMELDPHKPGGISILTSGFKDRNDGNKKANYSAEDVRVDKVFTDLAGLFRVEFHVTSVGVVVTPVGAKPFPNVKADKGKVYHTYKEKPGEQAADGNPH
jgi:hypothetical protein